MSNIIEKKIKVKGMHCNSCINLIESKVKSLAGIEEVKVSLADDEVSVKFNQNKLNLDKIKSEINNAGDYCCEGCEKNTEPKKESKGLMQGIVYGLIPHTGCIAFVLASILGATALMKLFKPLLLNRYFFHYLVLISFTFALVSSLIYLKKQGLLSMTGAKKKWKYLTVMFGTTIGINLLLFIVIFPLLANVSATGNAISSGSATADLSIKVAIPCPGHAPLISGELKTLPGVQNIKFEFPNRFNINYDPTKTSESDIFALEVFKTYKATKLR